ncbi:MAG: response regulator, partial [Candidatus Electrothrix sp. AUS4]|nr:response regulator [Candidatus Electrothrix sp. AUS4]
VRGFVWGKIVEQNDDGKPVRMAGTHTDINDHKKEEEERKKLEKELQQSQRLESIGLLAGGVAHDLNNILSGIIGYPELLLLDLPQDSKLRAPIEAIHESGQRATAVVADLLTVARGAASSREPHNINTLIMDYLHSPEGKQLKSLYPNIIFRHQFDATQPAILCSPVHIKKCLMNLVTNAVEAIGIDTEGTVTLTTLNQSVDRMTNARNIEPGEYVVLDIRDNGPGIEQEALEHIFEPFYSKKIMGRSGTGLGLTVVWNTMRDHKGKVFVESSHKGTYFQLYFPLNKEAEATQPEREDKKKITGHSEHILIVDDEEQLRDISSRMLKAMGYQVDSVSSGELAVEFVRKTPVDLIMIDMLMEPGMNGRQTYEAILRLYPGQRALIASGFSESDDVKKALKNGVKGFLKKPYSMEQLGQAVRNALTSSIRNTDKSQ